MCGGINYKCGKQKNEYSREEGLNLCANCIINDIKTYEIRAEDLHILFRRVRDKLLNEY